MDIYNQEQGDIIRITVEQPVEAFVEVPIEEVVDVPVEVPPDTIVKE